ncbi:MAG: lysophospholipid acyltransferase family protein [Ferruginibacter sp.]|nr:lysophospholipid acyltransferase family protein [Chitinophagaceae bacterium]
MYYVVYGFLWLVSLLPLSVLYVLSDGFYGLAFYVFKYRRAVVMNNLLIAFPEKTEKERRTIAKKFYHNLIDMFMETIKLLSVSDRVLEKRFTGNWDLVNAIYPTGKSVQFHVGHNFNWEWGNMILTKKMKFKLLAVYMPFTNKIAERLFYKLRTRNGAIFLRATQMKEDFLPHSKTQYVIGLVADQNPGHPGNAWWFNFFGRPTPFVKGPAKGAITNDTAVVFAFVHKPRRGYYEAVFSLATENAGSLTEQELTKRFVIYLESVIRQYPEMWLWSHRRWKWDWKPEYGDIIK